MEGDGTSTVRPMAASTRVIAIDWSGRREREWPYIWRAECRNGGLVALDCGPDLGRDETIDWLIDEAEKGERTVVGLDFAFSMPAWFMTENDVDSAYALWRLVADEGEGWLASCQRPFWGRPGTTRPRGPKSRHFRRTETEVRARKLPAKSVFQIGGAGAVGTASVRGMPYLRRLHDVGFSIWPFDEPSWPLVVEIYPRAFTGRTRKSRQAARCRWLAGCDGISDPLRELAAGSSDAFDAAVSALTMARHLDELEALEAQPEYALEGRIWLPA
jgi:hypothetical protein